MNNIEYFRNSEIMTLGEIIRYNNRRKIRKENVAEHSFYVATNVIRICARFNIPENIKLRCLELAIVHDIPEIFLGDVNYLVKRDNPNIAEALEKAELEALKKHMPEFFDAYLELTLKEKENSLEARIVKLADAISVLQYCTNEQLLGNTSIHINDILENAIERCLDGIRQIEEV